MRRRIAVAPAVLLLASCYDWSQAREDAGHEAHVDVADDARADGDIAVPDDAVETTADGPCTDPDRDDDGWPDRECGGSDCDDGDPTVWPGAPDNAGRWLVEVVHADAWGTSRLVLDRSDLPHFLFVDDSMPGVGLFHRWNDGAMWQAEQVADSPTRLAGAALALGPVDDLHAAYMTLTDRGPLEVRHAVRQVDETWSTDLAYSLDDRGSGSTALAVDGRGRIHVAFAEDDGDGTVILRVLSGSAGSWSLATVGAPADGDVGLALAVGPDDALHAAWSTWSSDGGGELIYAVRGADETGWRVETVTTHILASVPSLAIDAAGHAHLFAASADGTPYVTNAGGAWTFEAVDPTGSGGDSGAIALDPDGVPGIAYMGLGWDLTNELRWARRTAAGWVREEVPNTRPVEYDETSAAIDAAGHAQIVFHRGSDIVYAAEQPGVVPDGIDQDCDGVDG